MVIFISILGNVWLKGYTYESTIQSIEIQTILSTVGMIWLVSIYIQYSRSRVPSRANAPKSLIFKMILCDSIGALCTCILYFYVIDPLYENVLNQ